MGFLPEIYKRTTKHKYIKWNLSTKNFSVVFALGSTIKTIKECMKITVENWKC